MKTSSADRVPPLLERPKAWSYLVTNLLVLPGLGSIMGKRPIAGYLQILLSVGGFLITILALVKIALLWAQNFQLPDEPGLYHLAILGILVFLFAWFWSLVTSLTLFRKTK